MKVGNIFASKKMFVFNLVFFGAIVGFSLALLSFSCSTKPLPVSKAFAQDANKEALENLQSLQGSFRSVSKKVLPVVVMINVVEVQTQTVPNTPNLPWFYYFFGNPEEDEQSPREFRNRGLGSGIIVKKEKNRYYVLTNNHVIGNAEEINVRLNDQREFKASLVGKDERKDVAVISFEGDPDIPLAVLGDSATLEVGDWVLAVGNPYGLESTVTAGIVSALGRKGGPEENISDFIQTDAAINQGNSGGALVNLAGEVVGVNTWITSPTGGSIGLGFAIPINNVKKTFEELISKGTVQYGWLGVSIAGVGKEIAQEMGLPSTQGAFVYHVFKGSPADLGGILPGDFITSLNGKTVKSSDELVLIVGDLPIGKKAEFNLIRQGKPMQISVVITTRGTQQTISEQSRNLWPGFTVLPLTDEIRKELDIKERMGVLVQAVEPRTPGALAGLKSGDIIVEMNGVTITNLLQFYNQLNDLTREKIDFVYEREGVRMSIGIFR
ncbi:MAG TPA: Do family serine endopeptidase [Spirochaetales bacterium]|nr:Do family serine endopeptidase [Spirochaetales bacterium]